MLQLVKVNAIKPEYRIEGLSAEQVLRIHCALKAVPQKPLEVEVMVNCLNQDINRLNKSEGRE
jgi:hypothetical protein